jgi:hypothetical protein
MTPDISTMPDQPPSKIVEEDVIQSTESLMSLRSKFEPKKSQASNSSFEAQMKEELSNVKLELNHLKQKFDALNTVRPVEEFFLSKCGEVESTRQATTRTQSSILAKVNGILNGLV